MSVLGNIRTSLNLALQKLLFVLQNLMLLSNHKKRNNSASLLLTHPHMGVMGLIH